MDELGLIDEKGFAGIIELFRNAEIVKKNNLDSYLTLDFNSSMKELMIMRDTAQASLNTMLSDISLKSSELKLLKSKKPELFGMELMMYDKTNASIEDMLSNLNAKKSEAEKRLGILNDYVSISENYLGIDLGFLKLVKKHTFSNDKFMKGSELSVNLPAFAVFGYDSKLPFSVDHDLFGNYLRKGKGYYSARITYPGFEDHPFLRSKFGDMNYKNSLGNTRYSTGFNERARVRFSCGFLGFIPEETKSKIRLAKKYFQDQIYVISEAKEWAITSVKVVEPTGCPLVVGIKHDKAFLIDAFDCTPLEEYVKGTHVEGKSGLN